MCVKSKLTETVILDGVEADGVGFGQDRPGLDDRRADEGDGEDQPEGRDDAFE